TRDQILALEHSDESRANQIVGRLSSDEGPDHRIPIQIRHAPELGPKTSIGITNLDGTVTYFINGNEVDNFGAENLRRDLDGTVGHEYDHIRLDELEVNSDTNHGASIHIRINSADGTQTFNLPPGYRSMGGFSTQENIGYRTTLRLLINDFTNDLIPLG